MNNINNSGFTSIEQMTGTYINSRSDSLKSRNDSSGLSFGQILSSKQETIGDSAADINECSVRFSKHAAMRLADRNMGMSRAQMQRLENGARLASQKGIKESLVMVDNMAFIVNIPNNTVVTAVGSEDDRVFTNIDGAVIM